MSNRLQIVLHKTRKFQFSGRICSRLIDIQFITHCTSFFYDINSSICLQTLHTWVNYSNYSSCSMQLTIASVLLIINKNVWKMIVNHRHELNCLISKIQWEFNFNTEIMTHQDDVLSCACWIEKNNFSLM